MWNWLDVLVVIPAWQLGVRVNVHPYLNLPPAPLPRLTKKGTQTPPSQKKGGGSSGSAEIQADLLFLAAVQRA